MIQAWMGQPVGVTRLLGIAAPTVITGWLLVMGILPLRRRDSRLADGDGG